MLSSPTLSSQLQARSNPVGTSTSSRAVLPGGPAAGACRADGVAQPNTVLEAALLGVLPPERCASSGSRSSLPAAAASMRRSNERRRRTSAAAGRHSAMATNMMAVLAHGFSKCFGCSFRSGPCSKCRGGPENRIPEGNERAASPMMPLNASQQDMRHACLQLVEDLGKE